MEQDSTMRGWQREAAPTVPVHKTPKKHAKKRKRRPASVLFNVLFYAALAGILCVGLLYGAQGGRNIFGYSMYTVLTPSMQREIPQGSLVLVKETDTQALQVGDDITYLTDATTTISHRVVRIFENYEGSGARGFETKGLENAMADKEIVYASNVVGRIVFHTAGVGDTLTWIKARWVFVLALLIGFFILCDALKIVFFDDSENKENQDKKSKESNQ
ncbi:MAG: signal peptidase I [Oscillospiraceae bacterium]|jgi:signal peptidase|nr:signal peptidase I [Oscillospiraceae bacterium]